MVGGPQAAFDKVKPLFELMGKTITLVGGNGDGQTTKVANQIIVALTIEAVGEALLFASKAGADPAKVRQALMGGFASSKILEIHGERMVKRTFNPGFRIGLHQKDLNLALQSARALGVSDSKIMFRHMLPNAMVATVTMLPFIVTGTISTLAGLDFLGFGLPSSAPSLGELTLQAKQNLQAPWLAFTAFTGFALMLSLLVFIFEGVRDAFDPRKTFS